MSDETARWVDAKWGPFTTSPADIVPKYRDALIEAVEWLSELSQLATEAAEYIQHKKSCRNPLPECDCGVVHLRDNLMAMVCCDIAKFLEGLNKGE